MSCSDKSCSDKSCPDVSCQETICNICFDPIGQINFTTTPCGHKFCFKCIIKAYQNNPICPCCRNPLNDTENIEIENNDIEEEEEEVHVVGFDPHTWREYPWREGRKDFGDPERCYHFPAIIETVHDIHRVMCVTSFTDDPRPLLHILMHLIDPSYKFDNLNDLCAMEGLSVFKIAFDIYKKTQIIKKFAEKHIEIQQR